MDILIKSVGAKMLRYCSIRLNHTEAKVKYPTERTNIMSKERKTHPYRKIHPWKSKQEFIDDMMTQVIYNENGLVAVNKPYGISARPRDPKQIRIKQQSSGIPFAVNYTLTDTLQSLAKNLGYDSLTIVKTPERFATGVVLLSADDKITQAVDKSLKRAEGARIIPRTYWVVTRRIPIYNHGERRVAMKPITGPENTCSEPHIVTSWSENERSRGDIKILNVQFRILSHSTHNLASLLEIKSSTNQWHAIRLFAATVLMSPVLGDRVYGSRVQNVMGKFMNISAFVEAAHMPPELDNHLLEFLLLTANKTMMIPAHIHLKEMFLPRFLQRENDITITAPPRPEFSWTCEQLKLNEQSTKPVISDDDGKSPINKNI